MTESSDDADLALLPSGLRFARPDIEARFFVDTLERTRRTTIRGAMLSIVIWIVVVALTTWANPEGMLPWAIGVGGAIVATTAFAATLAARAWRTLPVIWFAAASYGGALAVALVNVHTDSAGLGLALAVYLCFFQFRTAVARLGPLALAVASYVLLELAFIASSVRAHTTTTAMAGLYAWTVVSAYGLALTGAWSIARSKRRSWQQAILIERQRAIIAQQRVLLEKELSHQVAERSRELGNVLAKSDVTLDARALKAGERFAERYKILSPLGAGGMGAVYEVERVTDRATLALKAVVGEVSGASAARFAREAEIGARVRHPNLISIVDVGVSSGVPFLAMELVRGGSLEAQRTRFGDVAWALPILRQIAEGLAALHDAGVVHRDLKPANVLLADGGVAKISDFGISRFGEIDDAAVDPDAATMAATPKKSAALTGTGVVMGTPLYMAPEAAKSARALDASADVFAFGILAYEMLTGRPPFQVPAFVLAMAGQPIPTPAAIDDTRAPAELRASVLACLVGDPAQRPRMRAVLSALTR